MGRRAGPRDQQRFVSIGNTLSAVRSCVGRDRAPDRRLSAVGPGGAPSAPGPPDQPLFSASLTDNKSGQSIGGRPQKLGVNKLRSALRPTSRSAELQQLPETRADSTRGWRPPTTHTTLGAEKRTAAGKYRVSNSGGLVFSWGRAGGPECRLSLL